MSKINKLGKSTFVIAILSFLLVAVLAFGGTYAYFSASAGTVTGTITTGHLRIDPAKNTTAKLTADGKIGQPNQIIFDESVATTVTSNIAYYTRVRFKVTVGDKTGADHHKTEGTGDCVDNVDKAIDILDIDIANGTDCTWLTEDATTDPLTSGEEKIYYKKEVTKATQKTDNATSETTETFSFTIQIYDWVGAVVGSAVGCDYWMDRDVTVDIIVEVLQADYLGDADLAADFTDYQDASEAWTDALNFNYRAE